MHRVQNMAQEGLEDTQTPEWGKMWTGWHRESRMGENVEQIAHGVWNGGKHGQDCTWSPELGIHRLDDMRLLE